MDANELEFKDEIVGEFLVETEELLQQFETGLIQLERSPADTERLNEVFRAAHTIKGTSAFLGFTRLSALTHAAEGVLNRLRRQQLQLTTEVMDALLATVDCLHRLVERIRAQEDETGVEVDPVIARLTAVGATEKQGGRKGKSSKPKRRASKARASIGEQSVVPATLAHSIETTPVQKDDATRPVSSGPASALPEEIQSVAQAPRRLPPSEAAATGQKQHATTVRVPIARLDELMNLVGELVLNRNRLNQITVFLEEALEQYRTTNGNRAISADEWAGFRTLLDRNLAMFAETSSQVGFITSELQMAVLQTRMLPVDTLFKKIPRLVRDLSQEMDKAVDLVLEGEDTELDRAVIEELGDVLTHLIRNALDHGIEAPPAREAAGKSRAGKLRVFAFRQGNHIHVGIEDDGAGIDPQKIKKTALERGLISKSDLSRMNDREAINLIFSPGFSTKANATSVSGRGVGMDVVKTNVSRLNGMIEVHSVKGKGTTFLLKLPLTLAIIQGLLVGIDDFVFIIPVVSILETLRVRLSELQQVGKQLVLRLRDRLIPIVDLRKVLSLPASADRQMRAYVVVIAIADKVVGLLVDCLLGQEEVVIKPLSELFAKARAFAGATIMGDGQVRLIIDVAEAVRLAQGESG